MNCSNAICSNEIPAEDEGTFSDSEGDSYCCPGCKWDAVENKEAADANARADSAYYAAVDYGEGRY